MSTLATARSIRDALPQGGLFHEKSWRVSPSAFPLDETFVEELTKLGYRLTKFVRACNQLYRFSIAGKQPSWIADLLERGKPADLVEIQRERSFAMDTPRVIRPDIILTDDGFIIAELDNVPGGIGLTAWLSGVYAGQGETILGGPEGMLDGFASILPGGDIVVSEEASTYRPEMEWLSARLNSTRSQIGTWRVVEDAPRDDWQKNVYRFFELFDLANVRSSAQLREKALAGEIHITPPFKTYLEEKLWFALFWLKPLEQFWLRELGERNLLALRKVIPYTWLANPEPLPFHAVLPRLDVHSWEDVGKFSQKQRSLILKISGFSETAWGSRGVVVAQDLPQAQWQQELHAALADYETHPHIIQQFHAGRLVNHDYLDENSGELRRMRGRVRLCPYYFAGDTETTCGGALVTIVPDDKKLIHGMTDAILVPAAIAPPAL
ncbi:hypothetical protein DB345_17015 [Spartobacteria bacterium LR76]|nr:hypothetical protein DB345_17015 [Spartobacteria bacterium LR76]